MKNKLTTFLLLIIILSLNLNCLSQHMNESESQVRAIDSFIKRTLQYDLKTEAAIVIAVIEGENVMFEKAYGKRDVLRNLRATTDTPFYIASVTKSFMGMLVKIMEKEGIINIDEPTSTYLGKDFKFANPNLDASKITIRDLITHQSGIVNDAITWRTSYTGEDANNNELLLSIFEKSDYTDQPFKYTNNGYILTGIILEKVTGKSWKELLNEKIFKKLKLNKTSTNPYTNFGYEDLALGHKMNEGKTILGKAQKQNENCHAAGGIFSSLFDMEKWIFMNMNQGKYNGKQVFPKEWMEEVHTPQITIESGFYSYKRNAYDLGWYHGSYEGNILIHCFGSFPGGYRSHVSYIPEKGIGVVVITNLFPEGIFLPDIVANYVYDTLLKKDSLREKYTSTMKRYNEILGLVKDEKIIKEKAIPTNLKKTYSGSYNNPEYGTLTISMEGQTPQMKLGRLGLVKSELIQVSKDTLKMLNADYFNRNDFMDISHISNGEVYLVLGANKVLYRKLLGTN